VRLGYKTWMPYNSIVLYGEPAPGVSAAVTERLAAAVQGVRERLGDDVFGEDDQTLAQAVGERLRARGLTLAVAESCTAGLAGAASMPRYARSSTAS
jgi:nicotinamide-nucleotide amidase